MATQQVEVLIEGGKATAAPPLGPALGPLGLNIGKVVEDINKKTAEFKGMQVPVKVTVNQETKEYTISVGTPPASALIKQEAGIKKGSGKPHSEFVADLKIPQLIKLAKMKEDALTGKTRKDQVKEIVGTCQSMGIEVEGVKAQVALKMLNEGKFDAEIKADKTTLSSEEMAVLEAEKKKMQAELAEKHAKEEAIAKKIIADLEGKDRSVIKTKLTEAGVSDELAQKLLPAEAPKPKS